VPPKTASKLSSENQPTRILRRAEVLRITGMSRSSLYDRIARGEFPRPRKLGPRAVGWRDNEIFDHIRSLPSTDPKK
jgi:prophage regulatory protein